MQSVEAPLRDARALTDPPVVHRDEDPLVRAGGYCAIAAIIIGFGGVFLAIAVAPWFSWTENFLSDLGHPSNPTAPIFNFALIIAAALYLEFVLALKRALPSSALTQAALILLAVGSLFLAGVGIFNETTPFHTPSALGYFFTYPPGIIVFGLAARRIYKPVGPLSWVMAVIGFLFGVLVYTPAFPSAAGAELAASLTLAAWTAVTGLWLLQGRFSPSKAQ